MNTKLAVWAVCAVLASVSAARPAFGQAQTAQVKITLDDHSLTGLLRPGMSAEPVINTKATVLAEQEPNSKPVSHLALARLHGG